MKAQTALLSGRYQYTPSDPLNQNSRYVEYKSYDRVTKRDLTLQICNQDDRLIQLVRDVKHPFLLAIFDVVPMEEGKIGVLIEGGVVCNLQTVLEKNIHLQEEDALVILKYLALSLKELHSKLVVYNRLCLENVMMCTFSLIKLGYNIYEDQMPLLYQSPEFIKAKQITYSSDVFSLGVILYRMVYGVFPFTADDSSSMLSQIKSKNFNESYKEGHSPFMIVVSKEVQYLIQSMLDFYEENRPTLEQILANTYLGFQVDTDFQPYIKPKVNLVPEPFIKKYLIYRPSKILHRYDNYYQQSSYMALSVKDKKMVTIYTPEIRMFEAEPRKIQSYFQKLRAIQNNYVDENCEFLLKLEDVEKFRQEPIFVSEYCNQGNLLSYLQKRKVSKGWFSEKQTNIIMYIVAIGLKQMRELGVTSIHTINSQRIMIKNKSLKLREPGMIAPSIEKRLLENKSIDYFAPELKENLEFVELDRSDMWSLGILYYYLLSGTLPTINEEGELDLEHLKTNQKNRNLIGKCLSYEVDKRLELGSVKIDNVDEDLLNQMLREKRQAEEEKQEAKMDTDEESNEENIQKDQKVMFKNRKKRRFKDYNKIIAESTTSSCRICIKLIIALLIFWVAFFGNFFINGGFGLLRTNYFKPITLQVPYNYGTSLINMTILTTDGEKIQNSYSDLSYEQFTGTLKCVTNQYSKSSTGLVSDFINNTHSVYCLFGFIFAILFSVLYGIFSTKLDLPTILQERKQKKDDKNLYHFILLSFMLPAMLFCFFYNFSLEYLMQLTPCFGIESLAYPKFTSIESLISGDMQTYFLNVFLTVVLWSILMILYGYVTLLAKKVNAKVIDLKFIIPVLILMVIQTVICRVGFGSSSVISPTWTYKINTDLVLQKYYGFLGFFPESLFAGIFILDRIIDFLFWYFLKLGLEGEGEADIKQVKIVQVKYEPIDDKKLQNEKSNIYMIEHDFERFD